MPITIRFSGICTHYRKLGSPHHRVVLVRADQGAYLHDSPIPPHIARLRIAPKHIQSIEGYPYGLEPLGEPGLWQIRGVKFTVAEPVGKLEYDPLFGEKVPRLICKESSRPSPSLAVVEREQAACYFDLTAGTFSKAEGPSGVINSEVVVETSGDPVLIATCFWNREECRIHLTADAIVEIEHFGRLHTDTDMDYLLHYLILENVPADAQIPEEKKNRYRAPGDISIGCSNSQYP